METIETYNAAGIVPYAKEKSFSEKRTRLAAPAYGIAFVSSASQVPDRLWVSAPGFRVEGRRWYEALEQSALDGQFKFLYAVISHSGEPIGVAPAFLMDVPMARVAPEKLLPLIQFLGRFFPSILHQRTLFIGNPCGDEGAIGILAGTGRRGVLLALHDALEEKARLLGAKLVVWKEFPESLRRDLDWLMSRRGLFRSASLPGTILNFASPYKEDYFKQLKGSRRYQLKKKLKAGAAQARLAAEVSRHPGAKELKEIFSLYQQTYKKSRAKFEELNLGWFTRIAELDNSLFIILRERSTGAMVAFALCLEAGPILINKYVGLDYSKPKSWMLYFQLSDAIVDWALANRFSSIHGGQSAYRAKIEMGYELIPLFNYGRYRNPLLQLISRIVTRGIGWEKLDADLALYLKAHPELKPEALR